MCAELALIYTQHVESEHRKREIYEIFPVISERMCENIELGPAERNGTQVVRPCVKAYRVQSHFEFGKRTHEYSRVRSDNIVHSEVQLQQWGILQSGII